MSEFQPDPRLGALIKAKRDRRWQRVDRILPLIPEEVRWTSFQNNDGSTFPVHISAEVLRAIAYQVLEKDEGLRRE